MFSAVDFCLTCEEDSVLSCPTSPGGCVALGYVFDIKFHQSALSPLCKVSSLLFLIIPYSLCTCSSFCQEIQQTFMICFLTSFRISQKGLLPPPIILNTLIVAYFYSLHFLLPEIITYLFVCFFFLFICFDHQNDISYK